MSETKILALLTDLPGFKMFRDSGALIIEAGGFKYDATYLGMEEAIINSYVFLAARILAEEIKNNGF